jgi:transmembrane sensor
MKNKLSQEEIEKLAYKKQIHTISTEEKVLLDAWYYGHDDSVFFHYDPEQDVKHRIWNVINAHIGKKRQLKLWPKILSAACLVLVAGFSLYLLSHNRSSDPIFTGKVKDINPGSNKAILTLSDGTHIDLNQAGSGNLATQGTTKIRKFEDGKLAYNTSPSLIVSGKKLNSIETPYGGQYEVVLSDGSKVWLNSKSSLHYPVSFNGEQQRIVKLTGEAYFEIAKDSSHPFIVQSKGQAVLVLGTHFNVNAYDDEPATTTTLTEGAIRLSGKSTTVQIKPNEQSVNNGITIRVQEVDASQFISWKDGYFEFQETDLKTAMRQIARWYNLKVVYSGEMPNKRFTGKIFRNLKLSSTLKILSYFDVKFVVSNNTIYINN